MRIAIDASRNRSGGAVAHLRGILASLEPSRYGILEVHLWSYPALLDDIPDHPWLVKHAPGALSGGLPAQLIWQAIGLANEIRASGCDILFTTDASSLCRFKPSVVLNQDLLAFEGVGGLGMSWADPGIMRRVAIRALQVQSLRRAAGSIFLTRYAARLVSAATGPLNNSMVISHGVDEDFRVPLGCASGDFSEPGLIRLGYVSPFSPYKNQLAVVQAVSLLRLEGFPVILELVGGLDDSYARQVRREIDTSKDGHKCIKLMGAIPHDELPRYMRGLDIQIFASSCEAFGITLLEAMSVGRPIACSNRSSLPETLGDGGVYFDPQDVKSIRDALVRLILSPALREQTAKRALKRASDFSWARCADETFSFIERTHAQQSLR